MLISSYDWGHGWTRGTCTHVPPPWLRHWIGIKYKNTECHLYTVHVVINYPYTVSYSGRFTVRYSSLRSTRHCPYVIFYLVTLYDDTEWAKNLHPQSNLNLLQRDALSTARCIMCVARYCHRKSSVRPSVTLRYRGHISWVSSKVLKRIISLGSSLLGVPTSMFYYSGNTPKIRVK